VTASPTVAVHFFPSAVDRGVSVSVSVRNFQRAARIAELLRSPPTRMQQSRRTVCQEKTDENGTMLAPTPFSSSL